MRVRPLPRGGVELTELGFGGAQIGNLYRETGEEAAADAVRAAWDAGVRYFDTAPHYGLGLSERRLGRALAGLPRAEFVVSTKVGRLLVPVAGTPGRDPGEDPEGFAVPAGLRRVRDYSRDGVLRSVEASLERLGLDRIDVVLIHDPDDPDHLRQAIEEAAPALSALRDQGVIRAYGAGMNGSAPLARIVRETDADVVMVAGRYTLLEQPALADLLPAALERGVGVVAAGVFNSGLLARSRPAPGTTYDYGTAPAELVGRATRLAEVCERHGTTLPHAAQAFVLRHPAVVSAVVGLRHRAQVEDAVSRYGQQVPDALWQELRALGLLGEQEVA